MHQQRDLQRHGKVGLTNYRPEVERYDQNSLSEILLNAVPLFELIMLEKKLFPVGTNACFLRVPRHRACCRAGKVWQKSTSVPSSPINVALITSYWSSVESSKLQAMRSSYKTCRATSIFTSWMQLQPAMELVSLNTWQRTKSMYMCMHYFWRRSSLKWKEGSYDADLFWKCSFL